MTGIHDGTRRHVAAQATLERFGAKPFNWTGATCIHLARFHAQNMGWSVPDMPRIRSPRSAVTALSGLGFADVTELLDSLFLRITPAALLLGDLATLPGSAEQGSDAEKLSAVVIADGVGGLIGWHAQTDFDRLRPIKLDLSLVTGAWRL